MKAGILKLTALSVVIGIGVLVVLQAKQGIDGKRPEGPSSVGDLGRIEEEVASQTTAQDQDEETGDGAPRDESADRLLDEEQDEIVPATRKLATHAQRKAESARPRGRRDRGASSSAERSSANETEEDFERLLDADDETDGVVKTSGVSERSPRPAAGSMPRRTPGGRGLSSRSAHSDDSDETPDTEDSELVESMPEPYESVSTDDADEAIATIRSRIRVETGENDRPHLDVSSLGDFDADESDASDEELKSDASSRRSESPSGRSRASLSAPDDESDAIEEGADSERETRSSRTAVAGRGSAVVAAGNTDDTESSAKTRFAADELETDEDSGFAGRASSRDEPGRIPQEAPTDANLRRRMGLLDDADDSDDELETAGDDAADEDSFPRRTAPTRQPSTAGTLEEETEEASDPEASEANDLPSGPKSSVQNATGESAARHSDALADDDEPPHDSPASARAEPSLEENKEALSESAERSSGERSKTPAAAAEPEGDDDPLMIRKRPAPAPPVEARSAPPAASPPRPNPPRPKPAADLATDEPRSVKKSRPKLTIEKKAPETAVLGRPMVYEILVRNTGAVAARGVTVEDVVPAGIRIDGSKPQAQLDGRRLTWRLGTLEPGAEQTIAIRVTPQTEGTLGGVATLHFESQGDKGSKTGPRLQVNVDAPRKAIIGQPVLISFKIRNVGGIDASSVLIHNVLPAGLRHAQGDDLEYEIGDLAAGAAREVQLQLTAAQAGQAISRAVITADGAVSEETVVQLDVVGPALSVSRTGPKKLSPGKKGRYTNTVVNPTSVDLRSVTLVETVPPGFEFLDATDGGAYDAARRSVTWSLGGLQPRESKSVSVSLNSIGRGSQVSVVRATDEAGASGESLGTTHIVGVPALSVEVRDLPGAVDVDEEVRVPIRVFNRGTDFAGNVRVTIEAPATLELVTITGPTKYQRGATGAARGRTEVRFDAIKTVDVKKFAEFELVFKGRVPGAGRLRVQAACDQTPEPIQRDDDITVVAAE